MPEYLVSLQQGLNSDEYEAAQKHAKDQGGEVTDVFDRQGIAPGFVVKFPKDSARTLESGPHVYAVEEHGQVRTQ